MVTDKQGNAVKFIARETYVYRKIDGQWKIVHEHASVPVDFASGRANLLSP